MCGLLTTTRKVWMVFISLFPVYDCPDRDVSHVPAHLAQVPAFSLGSMVPGLVMRLIGSMWKVSRQISVA